MNLFRSKVDDQELELARFREDFQAASFAAKVSQIWNNPRCGDEPNLDQYKCKYLEDERGDLVMAAWLILILIIILICLILRAANSQYTEHLMALLFVKIWLWTRSPAV